MLVITVIVIGAISLGVYASSNPQGAAAFLADPGKALNDILNRTVFLHEGQGGTLIVPGHGYLADEHEVVEYRDMVAIVRDRVRAMIKSGATLDQVKAARVTADYDTRYGANTGSWTTPSSLTW